MSYEITPAELTRYYLLGRLHRMFGSTVKHMDVVLNGEDETITVTLDELTYVMEVGSDDDAYVFTCEGRDDITIPFDTDGPYERTFSEIKSLPRYATEAELEAIAAKRGYILDGFTDQIDVRARNGRKIACYMA